MYMGARNDNRGYLQVEASVTPAEYAARTRIGVRRVGTANILASAPLQNGGKTPFSFNNAGGFQRYEVVAGLDTNSDNTLQNSEVSTVMTNHFILVTQGDYNSADNDLWVGSFFPLAVAADLLHAFRTGAIPPGAMPMQNQTLSSTNPSLTHPVGAIWSFNNTANVPHFKFPQSSDANSVSARVANDASVIGAIRTLLATHTAEVHAYFTQNPAASDHVFNWPIAPSAPDHHETTLAFNSTVLHFAFGHVTISGQMQVTVSNNRTVSTIAYEGSFTDIYDFNHNAGAPAPTAATVQTGFFTLGSSGNVFFTTVEFQRQDNNFNFQFQ